MSLRLAMLAAGLSGFVALSCEILWFRIYGFVTGGLSASFGVLLGAYLFGLALGSLWTGRACRAGQQTESAIALPATCAWIGTAGAWLIMPVVSWVAVVAHWAWTLPLVAAVAGVLGAILPLLSHFGIAPDASAGRRLSNIYLANIIGSTLGSLWTGFFLLDRLSLGWSAAVITVFGVALVLLLSWGPVVPAALRKRATVAALALAVAVPLLTPTLFDGIYERLQSRKHYKGERFAHVIETRSGVITVSQEGVIWGGGMYDGVFSTELLHDRNRIARAYVIPALHAAPKRVLMVGLASGSWAQVVAHMPGVEHLTIIEINPGYLELIRRFDAVKSLLDNPKVEIAIDDGRRWLQAHPDARFDVVVQNTTWHWRGQITGLLSMEWFQLISRHLQPGGLVAWNTTDSVHAQKTGCLAFAHALRYQNFMYASQDRELVFDVERLEKTLRAWHIDGKPVIPPGDSAVEQKLAEFLKPFAPGAPQGRAAVVERCPTILAACQDGPAVTDDNMVSEMARPWYAMPD